MTDLRNMLHDNTTSWWRHGEGFAERNDIIVITERVVDFVHTVYSRMYVIQN
jgi:hypothetical protein